MSNDPATSEVTTSGASIVGPYGATVALLAILLVIPIWAVENPPLVDYPNHLARGYILYHYDDVADFQTTYEVNFLSTPSLAIDAFLLALQPVCDVRTAGKIFLTLTLWLWLAGWHLLGCAIHGRPTWLALGAALFAYHSMFFYGFTNFSFGLGMYLIALAAWLYGRAHWPWPRHLLMVLLAVACYYCHMSAFLFLAGSVLAMTAWEGLRDRRLTVAAVVNLLPVLTPLVFFLRGGGERGFAWNTPYGKLVGALSLFRGYHPPFDIAFMACVVIFLILLFWWSVRIRTVGAALFTGLGCVFMFLVSPHELFGGTPADSRFLLAAPALVVLSFELTILRTKAIVLLVFFATLVAVRIGMIGYYWHGIDANLTQQVSLIDRFPEGTRVYPIINISQEADEQKRDVPAFHAVCYAVIDRRVYVPTVMGISGHTPLLYRTKPIAHHARADRAVDLAKVEWERVLGYYDFLWCHRVSAEMRHFLEERCTLVEERGTVTVWRVPKAR